MRVGGGMEKDEKDIGLPHNSKRWLWLFSTGIMTIRLIIKQRMMVEINTNTANIFYYSQT